MEILGAIVIAFAAFLVLALLSFASWSVWQFYKLLRDLRDQLKSVPVLLEGIRNICADLAGNTLALGGSVNVLKKSLIDETSGPRPGPGVMQYDDESADREYMRRIVEQNEMLAQEEGSRFIVRD